MKHFISGTYYDISGVDKAVEEIVASGYRLDRISVIMSSDTRRRFLGGTAVDAPRADGSDVKPSPEKRPGNSLGALLGTVSYAIVTCSIGALGEPLFMAGPVAEALAQAEARGGVFDLVANLDLPRRDAARLGYALMSGAIVVGVTTRDDDTTTLQHHMRFVNANDGRASSRFN